MMTGWKWNQVSEVIDLFHEAVCGRNRSWDRNILNPLKSLAQMNFNFVEYDPGTPRILYQNYIFWA